MNRRIIMKTVITLLLSLSCLRVFSAEAAPASDVPERGVSVIENRVSQEHNVAAGSYGYNSFDMLLLHTRPTDRGTLSDKKSTLVIKASDAVWNITAHTNDLHTWKGDNQLGNRVYVQVAGKFVEKSKSGGSGDSKSEGSSSEVASWQSNSLDIDIDSGSQPVDNDPEADMDELSKNAFSIRGMKDPKVTLRKLSPQKQGKDPSVIISRTNTNVDLEKDGKSIFPTAKTKEGKEYETLHSIDLRSSITENDLELVPVGLVTGDTVMTATLHFTDPSTDYDYDFNDAIRIKFGDPEIDIDVDTNRNGIVEDEADDDGEDAVIDYMGNTGALVLVNCDKDDKSTGKGLRDMDDFKVNGKDDLDDMSPIRLELKKRLGIHEHLYLVVQNADESKDCYVSVFDSMLEGDNAYMLGSSGGVLEQRMDHVDTPDGGKWFPDAKPKVYEDRFFIEGRSFAREVLLHFEVRDESGKVLQRDTVRLRTCPWLANNNTSPLAKKPEFNLVNSTSYKFASAHGAKITQDTADGEFVQDSVEWGFQVRRQSDISQSRTMISALRLHSPIDGQQPMDLLTDGVGIYGYNKDDEKVFESSDGDQGGNLECLPPLKGGTYGQIIHGDGMSQRLMNFLNRQKVQTVGGAIVLPITKLGLAHVDEVICILSNGNVIVPDWQMGVDLMSTKGLYKINIDGVLEEIGKKKIETFNDLHGYLIAGKGKELSATMSAQLDLIAEQVGNAILDIKNVKRLPGLYLNVHAGSTGFRQRSFPRGIANSQPIGAELVVSLPPQEMNRSRYVDSRFLDDWIKAIPSIKTENLLSGWRKGGEAHCSSNVVREPYKK